jgi:hypothetical protein
MSNKKIVKIIVLILFTYPMFSQEKENKIKVFYLGGQSNMEGFGFNKDLPDSLNKPFKDVYIFHGNPAGDGDISGGIGKWEVLKPGHGIGFSSDGKTNNLSDRFGVELSFAKRMQKLYPNDKIAIIKYSRNGTSIDSLAAREHGCWEPDFKSKNGINQYDHYLSTLKNAYKVNDIDGDGKTDALIPSGIVWMQGESDALTKDIAERYLFNLKRLMDLIRASLLTDDLPVVIGKISDSGDIEGGKVFPYAELIQYAQEEYVKNDENAAIVRDTKNYGYSDRWHYDSKGYIDLGERFANEIYKLKISH